MLSLILILEMACSSLPGVSNLSARPTVSLTLSQIFTKLDAPDVHMCIHQVIIMSINV